MLSHSDRAKIWEWNSHVPRAESVCVHELIKEAVLANPNLTALKAWDGQLTYQELDDTSSHLATWLRSEGLGRGVTLPLLFEKSMYATVALLGVIKAGASFVQLDVTLPEARLKDIVSQIDAPLLLASTSKVDLAGRLGSHRLAVVSEGAQTLQNLPDVDFPLLISNPSDTLYIVFTSGSTGKPKGAIICHSNVSSSAKTALPYLGIDSNTRWFDFCSYAFDASVYHVLLTLIAGGCVCVPSEEDRIERPEATLTAMAATATLVTPAVARMLDPLRTPTLETMMIAGESLSAVVMARWTEHVPVFNLYGPCECTALCTAMKYEKGSRKDKILIGRGVGCSAWVVNSEMDELVPIGTVGELIIQGPNVGCGYLNNSANMADAFICNPTWLSSGHDGRENEQSRAYVTGDLVRYDDNGYLDFLGRKDTQRKIRGQRFDLTEVENCAHAILGGGIEVVAEVCTAADAPGTNLLVGFVRVSDQNTALKQNLNTCDKGLIMSADQEIRDIGLKLKTSISRVLPAYMIPTAVVKLSRTPWILPSMKIDRKALRLSIGEMSRAQISEYETGQTNVPVMPATETQRLLQNIWAATLGMQAANIGLNANFFQLGGDSVSAIQLISTARTQGMHIKMANVLKNPNLSDMALALETRPEEDATESLVAPFSLLGGLDSKAIVHEVARCCNVREAQIEDVYPCTPLQEGMMALSMKKVGSLVACTVYELPRNIDFSRLRAAWIATARANSIMRTRIVHLGRVGMVQVVLANDPTFDAALTLEDCLSSHSNESLCLGSALDYFACIGENYDGPKYVVRKMHHAVCDGWQDHILLEQLTRAYQGEQIPKETMFNTFVRYVLNQNNEKASAFWREQLSGAPPVTFPVKRSAAYTPWASDSREHYVHLPSGSSDPHFTLSTSIRLAWALVLGEYTTSGDVVFGATLTGRNAPVTGIEKVTGPAIATVPLRIRLDYQDTVHCALYKIQEQAIAMLPYEQTGLQHIRKLGAEIANICDFQTLIVVQPPVTANDIAILKKCDQQPDASFPFGSYGLVLECTISSDRKKVAVKAQVDSSMLDPEQVDNILKQFDSVLSQICKYSRRRLAEIEVISPEDVSKLRRWNAKMPSSVDRTLHDLFGEQCHAHPMAPAISTSLEGLNYSELDDLSSRLATHLQTLGVRQGVVVPLFVGNSSMSPLAMLGVLKSGGTCACLDLGQPKKRLDHIIHEVDAKIALVAGSKSHLLGNFDVEFIPLTRSWLEALPRVVDVEWPQDATGAAFLVFTSGSTKAPKGIVLEHEALSSGVSSFIAFCGLDLRCRMLQFASSVFDVFIYEHLTVLLAGGCICIPSEHEKLNGIADFASKTKPNSAILTSTAVRSIDIIPSMRMLALAGEPVNLDAVRLWEPEARLVNGKPCRLRYKIYLMLKLFKSMVLVNAASALPASSIRLAEYLLTP